MSYVYQIEKHYIPFLRPIISQLYGQEIRLHYAVPKNDAQSVPVSKEADTTAISQFSTQTNTANIKKDVYKRQSLGSNLVGSLYILDEPSIGLHPRDTNRLVGVLEQLRDIGNTVIVVEHEEEVIRAAEMCIRDSRRKPRAKRARAG